MKLTTIYDDPIGMIEKVLRDLIHDVLVSKYGPNWHEREDIGLGTEWQEKLQLKKLQPYVGNFL